MNITYNDGDTITYVASDGIEYVVTDVEKIKAPCCGAPGFDGTAPDSDDVYWGHDHEIVRVES